MARQHVAITLVLLVSVVVGVFGEPSLYDTLGVKHDASDADIRQAYEKRAVQFHPDKDESSEAASTFNALSQAYQVLSNHNTRQAYDAALQSDDDSAGTAVAVSSAPETAINVFNKLFGAPQVDVVRTDDGIAVTTTQSGGGGTGGVQTHVATSFTASGGGGAQFVGASTSESSKIVDGNKYTTKTTVGADSNGNVMKKVEEFVNDELVHTAIESNEAPPAVAAPRTTAAIGDASAAAASAAESAQSAASSASSAATAAVDAEDTAGTNVVASARDKLLDPNVKDVGAPSMSDSAMEHMAAAAQAREELHKRLLHQHNEQLEGHARMMAQHQQRMQEHQQRMKAHMEQMRRIRLAHDDL